jgi:two-component system OmpR family response regulator
MAKAAKILVIDDDEDFRASLRAFLEKEGYSVVEAGSGKAGFNQVIQHKPDAIILDIMMETVDEGYGVTGSLRFQEQYKNYRDVPIVMVSSILETPLERYPYSALVDMIQPNFYLTKPLDFQELLQVLEKATAKARDRATGADSTSSAVQP